jgi:hypothetical protein
MATTINTINRSVDLTVRIFDDFDNFALEVPVNEWDVVLSFFEKVFGIGEAATASQIMAVTNSLLNMSEAELYKITDCEDKNKYPFFVVVLATTLIKDRKRAAADTVFKLIERAAGRAPQNVELRVENMIKPDIEALSEAEKIQLLNMLSKIDTESKTD